MSKWPSRIGEQERVVVLDSEVEITGQIRTVLNGRHQEFHVFACRLRAGEVAVQIDACGPDCACHPPIPSDDPAVIDFVHRLVPLLTQAD